MANRLSALRYLFNARTCILLKYWLILLSFIEESQIITRDPLSLKGSLIF